MKDMYTFDKHISGNTEIKHKFWFFNGIIVLAIF